MEHPELGFLNSLSGKLKIKLSEPPEAISPQLLNKRAPKDAKIVSVSLHFERFENDDFRELTSEERASIAFRSARITLRGESGDAVVHEAPDGIAFTVDQMEWAIGETARQTRENTDWFGGVDISHVYFEGLSENSDGTWSICWGS